MSKKLDLKGQKFGRLTVIEDTGKRYRSRIIWRCQCNCGNLHEVASNDLTTGHIKSCGCLAKEVKKKCLFKHGGASGEKKSRLYTIWQNMKSRCCYKNNIGYKSYGGRGIKVCDWWKNSFQFFKLWAMHSGYKSNLTIDRVDNDGHYCPANCRWIPGTENTRKKSRRPARA